MTLHRYGAPWQFVLANMTMLFLLFMLMLGGAMLLSVFNVLSIITAVVLVAALFVFIYAWATALGVFKIIFWWALLFLSAHIGVTIFAYAKYFHYNGLMQDGQLVSVNFEDAIYFSITTWTTLGYGDFAPIPQMRLLTSFEALTGVLSAVLTVSFMWAWCKENTLPGEMTLLEGNRVNKFEGYKDRVRTRKFSGKRLPMAETWLAITGSYVVSHSRYNSVVTHHGPVRMSSLDLPVYPWKHAMGRMRFLFVLFVGLLISSLTLGIVGQFPLIGGGMLLLALFVFIYTIPIALSFDRKLYKVTHACLLFHFFTTIVSYAMHYKWNFGESHSYWDALYFSLTTWTTLGYGDIKPAASMRLITSCEAISGIFGMSVAMSYLWHYCSELMPSSRTGLPFAPDTHHMPFANPGKEWFGMGILLVPEGGEFYDPFNREMDRVMRWHPELKEWEETKVNDLKERDIVIVSTLSILGMLIKDWWKEKNARSGLRFPGKSG